MEIEKVRGWLKIIIQLVSLQADIAIRRDSTTVFTQPTPAPHNTPSGPPCQPDGAVRQFLHPAIITQHTIRLHGPPRCTAGTHVTYRHEAHI